MGTSRDHLKVRKARFVHRALVVAIVDEPKVSLVRIIPNVSFAIDTGCGGKTVVPFGH